MESVTPRSAQSPLDYDPLIKKVHSEDPDIRFMVLRDLEIMLSNSSPILLKNDPKRSSLLTDAVIERLDDSNGDVQSQALKTVAPLSSTLAETALKGFLVRLGSSKTKHSLDDSVFITAVRTIIVSLPRPNTASPPRAIVEALDVVVHSVLPQLLDGLLLPSSNGGTKPESVDLAHQVILCYGSGLPEKDKRRLISRLLDLLNDNAVTTVVQKKAVAALAALSVYIPEAVMRGDLVSSIASRLNSADQTSRHVRMLLALIGSIAQSSRGRLDSSLEELVPHIFKATSQENFEVLTTIAQEEGANVQGEEAVEAALTALEELLASCPQAMRAYTEDAIDASTRFLSYDPGLIAEDDDTAMDEDDELSLEDDDDDSFEEAAGMSDSDDSSWKVRRCAAKVLSNLIRTRAVSDLLENGVLYERVAPILIKRLSEREESVRLETIAALARLVRLTGEIGGTSDFVAPSTTEKPSSRKRRRSSAANFPLKHQNLARGASSPQATLSPVHGPLNDLSKVAHQIAQAALSVLKQKQIASQQAALLLLKDLVVARHGRLETLLSPILEATVQIAQNTNPGQSNTSSVATGNAATATGTSLRVEAFRVLSAICDSHPSKALEEQVSDISTATRSAIQDTHFKVATEAIITAESVTKVLTPPRSLGATDKAQENIPKLYETLMAQVQSQATELEVRGTAIHALGFLLARTAGQNRLLGVTQREQGCKLLEERLRNEVTRLSSIEALDCVAAGSIENEDYSSKWLRAVAVELANQFRKADRTLSSTSLHTLHALLSHDAVLEALDGTTGQTLVQLLVPVLPSRATNELCLAAGCIARLVKALGDSVVDSGVIDAVTALAATTLTGNILEAYLDLVEVLGRSKSGDVLLQRLLKDVGVAGSADVNGTAIGTLLAAGGDRLGVTYKDIAKELQTTTDSNRKALALTILGQYGFCRGSSSPLEPEEFLQNLDSKADVARAAAIALGRAGAGDPEKYLPVILKSLTKSHGRGAALVPALREVLSHRSQAIHEITNHANDIWNSLIQFSGSEDGQVVAAECIGKLVALLPDALIPQLQDQLRSSTAEKRGLLNQALRYALSDSNRHLDDMLRPIIGDILTTLLNDDSLANSRLALMTFSAAISNKPGLVSSYIPQLSLIVIDKAKPDPTLIHTVAMGPFKHQVDDGLEVRKSAYDTLHTLINVAYSRLDSDGVFDRVVKGLGDDGDIKALCTLLVSKLLKIDREQSARHLHLYASMFQATLGAKLKESAVKQEIERSQEAKKDVIRATARISGAFPPSSASVEFEPTVWQAWQQYLANVRKEHGPALTAAEAEAASEG